MAHTPNPFSADIRMKEGQMPDEKTLDCPFKDCDGTMRYFEDDYNHGYQCAKCEGYVMPCTKPLPSRVDPYVPQEPVAYELRMPGMNRLTYIKPEGEPSIPLYAAPVAVTRIEGLAEAFTWWDETGGGHGPQRTILIDAARAYLALQAASGDGEVG